MVIVGDAETRSELDLPKVGLHAYMEHPSTDALCLSYTLAEDDEVRLWVPREQEPPADLCAALNAGADFVGHNVVTERLLFEKILGPRYGFPVPARRRFKCTMAAAAVMGLPMGLGRACAAVGLPEQKDHDGRAIMLSLSRPVETGWCQCAHRKSDHKILKKEGTTCAGCACTSFRRIMPGDIVWRMPETHPLEFQKVYAYCRQDTRATRALLKRLMPLSENELDVYDLDQEINDEGVCADERALHYAIQLAECEGARLNDELRIVTRGAIETCGQVQKIAEFCGMTDGLDRAAVEAALANRTDISAAQRRVLEIRQEAGRASVKKLTPMRDSRSGRDKRLRGMFQYHGAFTGRWAGRRVQPHNFPRPNLPYSLIDWILNKPETRFSPLIGKPLDLLANCMRSFLVADPGHTFVSADLSQIEARMLAWMAGEQETLDAYARGEDIYCLEATKILRMLKMREEPVTKADEKLRQDYGKIPTLACGYQGGEDSFVTMGKNYGTDIAPKDAALIVKGWRKAHPKIVQFWYGLEAAAIKAVLNPGMRVQCRSITYRKVGSFLLCKLPSGRVITYPYPKVERKVIKLKDGRSFEKDCLTYQTVHEEGHFWARVSTYGGKLCENVVQAASRCVLSDAMLRLRALGYKIVLHVHDEVVIKILKSLASLEILRAVNAEMARSVLWAPGLPVASAGWLGERYRK